MCNENQNNDQEKKKGFFARLFEKLDKKMEEKAKQKSCCGPQNDEKKSCCG